MPWTEVEADSGLFSWEHQLAFPLRTTAVRTERGDIALYSPTRGLGDAAHADLARLGKPSLAVAPNHFHYLGLPEHRARYPELACFASARARPRVTQKTGIALPSLDALRERLPLHVTVLEPAGTRNGEVWLSVKNGATVTWVVGDAWFTLPDHPPGPTGWFCRMTRTSRGLQIGATWLWLALEDRAAYRAWALEALEAHPPTRLVPCHGAVIERADLAGLLRQSLLARV